MISQSAPRCTDGTPRRRQPSVGPRHLEAQIALALHERQAAAITNFGDVLTHADAERALEATKDPYVFDFLELSDDVREREREQALIDDREFVKRVVLLCSVGGWVSFAPMLRKQMFWLFLLTGFAELGALLAVGDTTFSGGGAVVLVALLVWFGSGSRTAWWLFVVGNACALLMTVALAFAPTIGEAGGHTLWGNVITLSIGSTALLLILLSPTMRHRDRPPATVVETRPRGA